MLYTLRPFAHTYIACYNALHSNGKGFAGPQGA